MTILRIPALWLTLEKPIQDPLLPFSGTSCFAFDGGFKIWSVAELVGFKRTTSLTWQRWMSLMLDNAENDTEAQSPKNARPS